MRDETHHSKDMFKVALVLLDLVLQLTQGPLAVVSHGDGAGNLAFHINLKRLSRRPLVCTTVGLYKDT